MPEPARVATPAAVVEPTPATAALARVVARKPGGEVRPGQVTMCREVEASLAGARHLLVEAPTGTGKSLAYLVPAVLFATSGPPGRRVFVVTATKALQEQLVGVDLPFLAEALAADGVRFSFAMVKGRSNYLCRAKLDVALADGVEARLDFGSGGPAAASAAVGRLAVWAATTASGDRADAPEAVSDAVWSQVSVDEGECPGRTRCSRGDQCFAEAARDAAAAADVVVVNTHLYATHLASDGAVLPEHEAVVFDEGHTLEGIVSSVVGVRLSAGRVRRAAARARGAGVDAAVTGRLDAAASALESTLDRAGESEPRRVAPIEGDLARVLGLVAQSAAEVAAELRQFEDDDARRDRAGRAARLADGLREDLGRLLEPSTYENHVAWIESGRGQAELHLAAVDVGPILATTLFGSVTVVVTSATLATAGRFDLLARRLGLQRTTTGEEDGPPPPAFAALAVPSPFDHREQALLYVPTHLPDPRHDDYPTRMLDELDALVRAAGGRTLALFTSRAAMRRAAEELAGRGGYEVLVQDDLPRAELLARFRAGPGSVLVATQSFWSGIDLPGSLCTLVTIDKIPFPRPTDPLSQARREAATARGERSFDTVDLPAAASLLAQGAGRLIRSTADRGVVAVLDRRLAVAGYRPTLLATLPPFRRTLDRAAVIARLEALAADAG